MKIIDKFKNPYLSKQIIESIYHKTNRSLIFMEFCGTHTHSIFKYGIRELLPKNIMMLSGPGCPVCVTDQQDIDLAISLAKFEGNIITTFGDLMRVPGSDGSNLLSEKARGAEVKIVYSPLDALKIAQQNKQNKVIFLGIGFETTTPAVAATILKAANNDINNFYVFSMHKLTPPATLAILKLGEIKIDGILGPGHVSTITGASVWNFIPDEYRIPFAIAGFEAVDILSGIDSLIEQSLTELPKVVNTYSRSVKPEGNLQAQQIMQEVFTIQDVNWRGLGVLPGSGLKISEKYRKYDALNNFSLQIPANRSSFLTDCKCHEILRGILEPISCPLFKTQCNPDNPLGACMVSSEGPCFAYYLYYRG